MASARIATCLIILSCLSLVWPAAQTSGQDLLIGNQRQVPVMRPATTQFSTEGSTRSFQATGSSTQGESAPLHSDRNNHSDAIPRLTANVGNQPSGGATAGYQPETSYETQSKQTLENMVSRHPGRESTRQAISATKMMSLRDYEAAQNQNAQVPQQDSSRRAPQGSPSGVDFDAGNQRPVDDRVSTASFHSPAGSEQSRKSGQQGQPPARRAVETAAGKGWASDPSTKSPAMDSVQRSRTDSGKSATSQAWLSDAELNRFASKGENPSLGRTKASAAIPAPPQPKDPKGKSEQTAASSPDLMATVQQVGLATVVIVGGCVVVLFVLAKLGYRGPKTPEVKADMKILGTSNIHPKCQLQLVQVDQHRVLVGVDSSGIKSMVCLPNSFSDELSSVEESEVPPSSASATSPEEPRDEDTLLARLDRKYLSSSSLSGLQEGRTLGRDGYDRAA